MCVAELPSGQIVTGSVDTTLSIWRDTTLRTIDTTLSQKISGHTKDVNCVAVTHDGNWIISGSNDTTVRKWGINKSGNFVGVTEVIHSHKLSVKCLIVLRDDSVVSGSLAHTIRHSNIDSIEGADSTKLLGHEAAVLCLTELDTGELASGSEDKTVRLWDLGTQTCLHVFQHHQRSVLSMAQLPDGRIVTGCDTQDSCVIRILAPDGCCEVANGDLNGKGEAVNSVVVLPTGDLLLGSKSGMVYIVDVSAAHPATEADADVTKRAQCLAERWVVRCAGQVPPEMPLVPEQTSHKWVAGATLGLELNPVLCEGGAEFGARVVSVTDSEPRELLGLIVSAVRGPGVPGCDQEAPWSAGEQVATNMDYKMILRKLAMAGRPMTVEFHNDNSTDEFRNAAAAQMIVVEEVEPTQAEDVDGRTSDFYPARKNVVLKGSLYTRQQ